MDKVLKIGNWIWLNKERMVLGIMVVILGWQVYIVVNPPKDENDNFVASPPGNVSPPADQGPPSPSNPPPPPAAGEWSSLVRSNPWWVYAQPLTGEGGGKQDDQNPGVILLDIQQMSNGEHRARLQTVRPRWYREGESFESFRLERINAEEQTVVVYSEKHGRRLTIPMQRRR
ncbi:MAG: hypothetical protein HY706_07435 [Candidatus Hydrogenedentes bacterium]|nr:hypothetical protein [Candidatus Hydrogenedentota bacterium]